MEYMPQVYASIVACLHSAYGYAEGRNVALFSIVQDMNQRLTRAKVMDGNETLYFEVVPPVCTYIVLAPEKPFRYCSLKFDIDVG